MKQNNINILQKIMKKYELIPIKNDIDYNVITTSTKIDLVDKNGYKYNLSYVNLNCSFKRSSELSKFFRNNIYTIDNIKNYLLINNIEIELVSKCIFDAKDKNVEWRCLKHNTIFKRAWNQISSGYVNCQECVKEAIQEMLSHRKPTIEYIKEFCLGKYDIVIISNEYRSNDTKLMFECNKHKERGVQYKSWSDIRTKSHPCLYCSKEKQIKNITKTNEQFLKDVKRVHGNKYILLEDYVNCRTKIKCKCTKCKKIFAITPSHLLEGHGCPYCVKSKGEERIEIILQNNNINYIREYKFDDCIGICKHLPFDFYIPDINLCIEFQGIQHYKPIEIFGGQETFEKQKINDNIKREYCKKNNINLLEISYKDIDNIELIIQQFIK